jgi:enamine deaminase RidA (YjgF/YER057c/UK114 family)
VPSTSTRTAAVLLTAAALVGAGGYAAGASTGAPPPTRAVPNLPPPSASPNPLIANGVSIGKNVAVYKSSGLGPGGLNPAAPAGTPERFLDLAQFPGGALPAGVTITEAQAINVLARIEENLASVGLGVQDVTSMRVFLDNAPGAPVADYAGWNRAYRQFFANTNRVTGDVLAVPLGTAPPAAPLRANPARPSRFTLEVASLPVQGWLVEVEVDAVFPG